MIALNTTELDKSVRITRIELAFQLSLVYQTSSAMLSTVSAYGHQSETKLLRNYYPLPTIESSPTVGYQIQLFSNTIASHPIRQELRFKAFDIHTDASRLFSTVTNIDAFSQTDSNAPSPEPAITYSASDSTLSSFKKIPKEAQIRHKQSENKPKSDDKHDRQTLTKKKLFSCYTCGMEHTTKDCVYDPKGLLRSIPPSKSSKSPDKMQQQKFLPKNHQISPKHQDRHDFSFSDPSIHRENSTQIDKTNKNGPKDSRSHHHSQPDHQTPPIEPKRGRGRPHGSKDSKPRKRPTPKGSQQE